MYVSIYLYLFVPEHIEILIMKIVCFQSLPDITLKIIPLQTKLFRISHFDVSGEILLFALQNNKSITSAEGRNRDTEKQKYGGATPGQLASTAGGNGDNEEVIHVCVCVSIYPLYGLFCILKYGVDIHILHIVYILDTLINRYVDIDILDIITFTAL